MRLSEVTALLQARAVSDDCNLRLDVKSGGAADLMSDVLAFHLTDGLLLTGLTNPQVVRTAEVAGVAAIVFVRGKVPPDDTVKLAEDAGIPLVATKLTMFDACGRLYQAGLRYSPSATDPTAITLEQIK